MTRQDFAPCGSILASPFYEYANKGNADGYHNPRGLARLAFLPIRYIEDLTLAHRRGGRKKEPVEIL